MPSRAGDVSRESSLSGQIGPRESFRGQMETGVSTCKLQFPFRPETTPEVLFSYRLHQCGDSRFQLFVAALDHLFVGVGHANVGIGLPVLQELLLRILDAQRRYAPANAGV